MAKEILILETLPIFQGKERYSVLFFFPVDPVIEVNSLVVKPSPSDTLPAIIDEYNLMTTDEKATLDSGTYAFIPDIVERAFGESNAVVIARAKRMWQARSNSFVSDLRRQYELTGSWVPI